MSGEQARTFLPHRWLRLPALGLSALFAALFLFVALSRLRYPYELEFITGGIVHHVERVRAGLPLYAPPTTDWVAFIYPPLYYQVAAAFTHLMPGPAGCRLLSLCATLLTAGCVFRLAKACGATRERALLSVGLFFACFSYGGFWYDLERSDSLYLALVTLGAVVLVETRSSGGAAAAGLLFGADFFAKQLTVFFLVAFVLGLLLVGERRRALTLLVTSFVVVGLGTLLLNHSSDGWYSKFIFGIPSKHPFRFFKTMSFVDEVATGFVLLLGAFAVVVSLVPWLRGRLGKAPPVDVSPALVLLAAALLAAIPAYVMPRFKAGGFANNVLSWSTFASVAAGVALSKFDDALRAAPAFLGAGLVEAALVIQFAQFAYDPRDVIPGPNAEARWDKVAQRIRALEDESPRANVWVLMHSRLGRQRHANGSAVMDYGMSTPLPPSFSDPIRRQEFSAIVVDFGNAREFNPRSEHPWANSIADAYQPVEPLPQLPGLVVGYSYFFPRWILRPRPEVLPDLGPEARIERLTRELSLAEAKWRTRGAPESAERGEQ